MDSKVERMNDSSRKIGSFGNVNHNVNHNARLIDAETFLAELGRGIPAAERVIVGYADEATVQTDPETGRRLNAGWWPKPWKTEAFIPGNKNAYACISSAIQTPNPKTGQMRWWRSEQNFGHGLALMVDDIGDGKGSKGSMPLADICNKLPPTAIIETSPSNYQAWYFLDKPVPEKAYFKAFLSCFVKHVIEGKGGDHTIKDITRVGRMPFGLNNKRLQDGSYKYADENGNPFWVRLHAANYDNRYSIEEIAKAFGFVVKIPPPRERLNVETVTKADEIWFAAALDKLARLQMGEGSNGDVRINMSGKYRIRCPWGHTHANGDPYGAFLSEPCAANEFVYVFGCAHDSCKKAGHGWGKFVDEFLITEWTEKLDLIGANAAR